MELIFGAELCARSRLGSKKTSDVLLRNLDCEVIQQINDFVREYEGAKYDSVSGIFIEGN